MSGGGSSAAGCQQVVHQNNLLPRANSVDVDLHIGLAVLQGVGIANRLVGQFSLLSDRNKTDAEFVSHRCAKKESARVDAHYFLGPEIDGFLGQKVNYLPKQIRIGQDRSNVSE